MVEAMLLEAGVREAAGRFDKSGVDKLYRRALAEAAIERGGTKEAAAVSLGVSVGSIYNWLRHPRCRGLGASGDVVLRCLVAARQAARAGEHPGMLSYTELLVEIDRQGGASGSVHEALHRLLEAGLVRQTDSEPPRYQAVVGTHERAAHTSRAENLQTLIRQVVSFSRRYLRGERDTHTGRIGIRVPANDPTTWVRRSSQAIRQTLVALEQEALDEAAGGETVKVYWVQMVTVGEVE